jgi:MYXO-CTERM domain-containing protein
VDVRFVPRPDVLSKAALEITSSDVESPVARVTLAGKGLSTVFRALSRTVDFGTLRQSDQSLTKLVLTNDSSQPIVLKPPKIEGSQAYNFTVVSPTIEPAGRTLAPGASITLELKFDTAQASISRATLVLDTQAQERAALVLLMGRTVPSFLATDPMSVDFDWVDIGAQSEPQQITLTNQSGSPTRVSLLEEPHPAFEVDSSELSRELAPGEQATLRVTFRPAEGGSFTGDLRLRRQGETEADVSIALSGQARTLAGEGGCACGAGSGGSALLGLLVLAVLRSRRRDPC